MSAVPVLRAAHVDGSLDLVEGNDVACLRLPLCDLGIVDLAADLDLVLLRWESVAPVVGRNSLALAHDALDELELADRLGLLHEGVLRQTHQLVEAPPRGLVLPPVPVDEVAHEPGRLFGVALLGRVVRNRSCQALLEVTHRLLSGGKLLVRRVDLTRRARQLEAELARGLRSAILQPIAQLLGADAVVAVVEADVLLDLAARVALLEHHLELDDARVRVSQLDLACVPVERLELLDRVALGPDANALANCAIQVHEDPTAQQLVELLLARRVPTNEDLEVARLIRPVVVDVHLWVVAQTVREE